MFSPDTLYPSLADARAYIVEYRKIGVICPCCDQRAQEYKRSMYYAMVVSMIRLHRLMLRTGDPWHHLDTFAYKSPGDFAKCRYWGLIRQSAVTAQTPKKKGAKTSGIWTVTDLGRAFLADEIKIIECAWIYDSICTEFSGPLVNVRHCLGKTFDYDKLMTGDWETKTDMVKLCHIANGRKKKNSGDPGPRPGGPGEDQT